MNQKVGCTLGTGQLGTGRKTSWRSWSSPRLTVFLCEVERPPPLSQVCSEGPQHKEKNFFSISLILYLHDMMDKCMVMVMVVMVVVMVVSH